MHFLSEQLSKVTKSVHDMSNTMIRRNGLQYKLIATNLRNLFISTTKTLSALFEKLKNCVLKLKKCCFDERNFENLQACSQILYLKNSKVELN